MTRNVVRAVLAALVLASGPALALPASGVLEFAGALQFESPAAVTARLWAGYGVVDRTGLLFTATATDVTLDVYEAPSVKSAAHVRLPAQRDREVYENVKVRISGAQEGYLAFTPSERSRVRVDPQDGLVEPRTRTMFGYNSLGDSTEQDSFHSKTITDPHLFVAATEAVVSDAFRLKVYGPRIVIEGREGVREIQTGWLADPSVPGEISGFDRWVVLGINGTGESKPGARLAFVLGEGTFEHNGHLEVTALQGRITTPRGKVIPIDGPLAIDGDLEGSLRPGSPSTLMFHGDVRRARLASGDVDLASAVVVSTGPDLLLPGLALVVLAGAVAAGIGIVDRVRRRPRLPASSLTAETCLVEASRAAEAGDWGRSLDWIRRGRPLAPKSARLAMDEAYALERLGDFEGALAAYEEASRLADDGVAEFSAARMVAALDRPGAEIAAWIERALRCDRDLAIEILDDAEIGRYTDDPHVRAVLARVG